jgi:heptosyltransferase-2
VQKFTPIKTTMALLHGAGGGIKRVLIVAPNWIGDAVMSLSLLQALHEDESLYSSDGKPCELHVLAPAVTAPVYQFSPVVHSVQSEPFQHGKLQLNLRRCVGRALRAGRFDLSIVLPNALKAALVPWFAGIPTRIGYAGELRTCLLTQALPKPSKHNKPPMIQWYGALGGYALGQLKDPLLHVAPNVQEDLARDFHLQTGFLALAPGAEYGPAKRWPAEYCAEVVTAFLRTHVYQQAVLFGGPKDVDFCQTIRALVPEELHLRLLVLAGKTSLQQAIALLASAAQLVTNDSGLMHVGAALGVQIHAVYGSSSPKHTPPLSAKAKVYYLGLPCSPCFQRDCPLGHTDCLVGLKPKMVIDALESSADGV